MVFCISLECNHNFFITENDILVHNLGPFAIGTTVAFGSGGLLKPIVDFYKESGQVLEQPAPAVEVS